MKKIILATLISGAMSTSALAADAGQGTVTFEGSIIEAACGISPDTANQTVDLGQVTSASLMGGGKSQPKSFTIELVDCDVSSLTEGTAAVTFTGGMNPNMTNALAIQGSAAGAGVVIAGVDGQPVTLDGSKEAASIKLQDSDNTLLFSAYLQGEPTGTPTTGAFTALANFTMQYE